MIKAVFDTNVLISAFLSRNNPGGVSNELLRFARQGAIQLHLSPEIVVDPPATPGAVPRDPDDDMIVACAVAASVKHIVSRDDHVLSLGSHAGIPISAPEQFIGLVREKFGRLPDQINPPKNS
jgi:predicted nucleic acid-binding protein